MHVGVFLSSLNIILSRALRAGDRTRSRRIRHHAVGMQLETFDQREMMRFPIFPILDILKGFQLRWLKKKRNLYRFPYLENVNF